MQGGVYREKPTKHGGFSIITASWFGAELRWLGGYSFPGPTRSFFNVEATARTYGGDCSEGKDQPAWGDPTTRLQLSMVRFGDEARAVQIGLRGPLDGDEGPLMLVLGLWD